MQDGLVQPEPTGSETPTLDSWKDELRRQFELWLEGLEQIPESQERTDAPDLYSLYEELAALRNETRKGNRKTAEVFGQVGESLDHVKGEINRLREQLNRADSAVDDKAVLPRSYLLGLVEMFDRIHRLGAALERPPRSARFTLLRPDGSWKKAWTNVQQGVSILLGHFEQLLGQAGIQRVHSLGKPFDPVSMLAVAIVPPNGQPQNVVVEEIAPGFRWRDQVLRPAEVKITKTQS
jgi:molecular chaperone GrpE (heat shock protein)